MLTMRPSLTVADRILPAMGALGYVSIASNMDWLLDTAWNYGAQWHCIIPIGQMLWPLWFPWALGATWLLLQSPKTDHRWSRYGLVLGLACWLAPLVVPTICAPLVDLLQR